MSRVDLKVGRSFEPGEVDAILAILNYIGIPWDKHRVSKLMEDGIPFETLYYLQGLVQVYRTPWMMDVTDDYVQIYQVISVEVIDVIPDSHVLGLA